jgi:hypothetical protein
MAKVKDPVFKRSVGRPRNYKQTIFCEGRDLNELAKLAVSPPLSQVPALSGGAPVPVMKLAEIAVELRAMARLQKHAPVRGTGRRPKIHIAVILRDCALLYEKLTGTPVDKSLKRIADGRREHFGPGAVEQWARAVIEASSGVPIDEDCSLRQQARLAMKLRYTPHPS